MGKECVSKDDENWPVISEALCTGCGLCPKRCPAKCIKIINLLEEKGRLIHQYGVNSFRLYNLPLPKEGSVVGLIGPNGIGKSTALQILSGKLIPNLGNFRENPKDYSVLETEFRGQEIQNYFVALAKGETKISLKPQNVDKIPEVFKGKVKDLLKKTDERKKLEAAAESFGITEILDRNVSDLSGGELQRVAIVAAYLKDASLYYFDEPTSYLDIKQRLIISEKLKGLAEDEKKAVAVVEHDLAALDYLSDYVNVFFGEKGAYGVVSSPKSARNGMNEYLDGFLKDENMRIRDYPIKIESGIEVERKTTSLVEYGAMEKSYKGFTLKCEPGILRRGEIIGILGENAIGKTTFVKLIAGVEEPDKGEVPSKLKVSYKPQYVKTDFDGTVSELIASSGINREIFEIEVKNRMEITELLEKNVAHLSGGELQRVSIAIALSKDADLYLLDEPSAFLDIEQRLNFSHVARRVVAGRDKTAFIVDHDIALIDAISSRVCVFEGTPAKNGIANSPEAKKSGMNRFLKDIGITIRKDRDTKRPRINKPGSRLDSEQRESGDYYYA